MKRTAGFVIVGLMIVLGLLSLVWTPYDPLQANPSVRLLSLIHI